MQEGSLGFYEARGTRFDRLSFKHSFDHVLAGSLQRVLGREVGDWLQGDWLPHE